MSNQGWHAIRPRIGALTASAFSPPAEGGGTVTAPAATTEDLPDTDTPTAKTFGAFTDTEGLIDNYVSTIVDIVGTTTASGSGLGPYTYSGAGPGTAFVHLLTARDASNNPLATAAHGVDIMPSPPSAVTAPAATSESVASGGSPANKTFSAFTDPDGLIDNYVSAIVHISGTTTASGSGLGPWSYSGASDGTAFAHTLTARDADNNPLATAVHGVQVASLGGAYDWVTKADIDLSAADLAGPWSTGTNNITTDSGATTIATVTVTRSGSTGGTVQVAADGLTVTGVSGTGNVNAAINLDTLLGTDSAFFTTGDVLVQIAVTGFSISTTGYMLVGVSPLAIQGTGLVALFLNSAGIGAADLSWYYDATAGSVFTAGSGLTSFVLDLRIMAGRFARARVTAGTTTFDAPADVTSMSHPGSALQSAASSQVFGSNFNLLCSVKHICTGTISRVRVSRLEAV